MKNSEARPEDVTVSAEYQAPRIELVVTEEAMEREVHYAGSQTFPIDTVG